MENGRNKSTGCVGGCLLVVLIIGMVVFFFASCGNNSSSFNTSDSSSSSSSSSSSTSIVSGKDLTLVDDTIFATSKDNENKLESYLGQNNTSAEQDMLGNGEAIGLLKGTTVHVIDAGAGVTEVETSDGTDYYTPTCMLQ